MSGVVDIVSTVTGTVGSGAVVLALLYSSRQTKVLQGQLDLQVEQAERMLASQRASNDLALMTQVMGLDRLFIEQPDLREYFYEDRPIPDAPHDRARVESAAELIVDLADSVAGMIRLGQLDPEDVEAWTIALRWYGRSPAVRKIAASGEGAWRPATLALLSADPEGLIHPVGTNPAHSSTTHPGTHLVTTAESDRQQRLSQEDPAASETPA